MDPKSAFTHLMGMVMYSFKTPVSILNYFDLVKCIDLYKNNKAAPEDEHAVLSSLSLPTTYDVCFHRENIRFGMIFVDQDDVYLLQGTREFLANKEKEQKQDYEQRAVNVTYDDTQQFFKIQSKDGKAVLQGYPAQAIKSKGLLAYCDGHAGTSTIIIAPKEEQFFIEQLFYKE